MNSTQVSHRSKPPRRGIRRIQGRTTRWEAFCKDCDDKRSFSKKAYAVAACTVHKCFEKKEEA